MTMTEVTVTKKMITTLGAGERKKERQKGNRSASSHHKDHVFSAAYYTFQINPCDSSLIVNLIIEFFLKASKDRLLKKEVKSEFCVN